MPKHTGDLIRSLWPLPGGNTQYVNTLNRMLKWVASTGDVTESDLINWFASNYNLSESSVYGYARVIYTLGAIETKDSLAQLTLFGRKILEAEEQEKAKILIDRFMQDYLAFREVLAIYDQAEGKIHLGDMAKRLQPYFPRWTSAAQYEYRALWLLSLGALEQISGRYYAITEFGKAVAAQYPPIRDINTKPLPTQTQTIDEKPDAEMSRERQADVALQLAQELQDAAIDSKNPQRLEQAAAQSFEFLGFSVDHMGASGETDVLVRANIGERSYIVVVDAKSRSNGKLQDLNVLALLDHKKQNQAHFALVVAGDFAGGKIVNHARDNGVVLMSVPLLIKWLRLHAKTPLHLDHYRSIFAEPGRLADLPNAVELAFENQLRWGHLLVDLMELFREAYEQHGLNETLPREQIFYMLMTRLRGVRYSKEEVQQAIEFLTHPALGAMLAEGNAISLAMNRPTLALTLRKLADRIETSETETNE